MVCHRRKSHFIYQAAPCDKLICIAAKQIAFYGLGLNSSSILTPTLLTRAGIISTPPDPTTTLAVYQSLHSVVIGNLIVSVAGLLPGYYVTLCFIDGWGRKPIQYLGFAMLTVLLAVLGKIDPTHQEFVRRVY